MRSNAEIVVDVLERAGVRSVFGLPGAQNARFIEALYGSRIKFVLVSHEAGAGFMADVTSRLTGRIGVCLSTLGPGATNMATGVGNAYLDRVPVLALTATMGRKWKNRTVQMQIDHRRLYGPITKWSAEMTPGDVYPLLEKAIRIARSEPPGPVHLDMPEDFAEELSGETCSRFQPQVRASRDIEERALGAAETILRGTEYPLLAVGLTMNRAGATRELREVIRKHDLPVVTTLMAKGQVEESDPHFVGVLGRARRDLVNAYCARADLVIGVGYDPVEFNYEEWLRKDVPLLSIDTVPVDIDPGYSVAGELRGDIRTALRRILRLPALQPKWSSRERSAHRERLLRALTPRTKTFSPHRALISMREALPADGILVSDVGAHTHVLGQLWDTKGPVNFLVSNGWSSMGFAIPAAVAAKLARPDRVVFACVGDGGFLMSAGEINTAVRMSLPIVFVIFRDNYLSLIRVKQKRKKYHPSGVRLFETTYRSSDNFFGARVITAEDEESFRDALREGLASKMPTIIEAAVDPREYETLV